MLNQILEGVHIKSVEIRDQATSKPLDWKGNSEVCPPRVLSNSNGDEKDSDCCTLQQNKKTHSILFLCFCIVLVCYTTFSIVIKSHFASACHLPLLWLHWKQETLYKTGRIQIVHWNIMAFMSVTHTVSSRMYLADLWIVVLWGVSHLTCQSMNIAWQSERRAGFWENLFRLLIAQVVR